MIVPYIATILEAEMVFDSNKSSSTAKHCHVCMQRHEEHLECTNPPKLSLARAEGLTERLSAPKKADISNARLV